MKYVPWGQVAYIDGLEEKRRNSSAFCDDVNFCITPSIRARVSSIK